MKTPYFSAGSVYRLPLHRRASLALWYAAPWLASLGLGLFIFKAAQIFDYIKGLV